jgi:hypothetical protein
VGVLTSVKGFITQTPRHEPIPQWMVETQVEVAIVSEIVGSRHSRGELDPARVDTAVPEPVTHHVPAAARMALKHQTRVGNALKNPDP